jgi:molybdopterin molybdotransferase
VTAERRLIDDCFLTDSERLSHDEALRILRERIRPVADTETIPLGESLGRVIAENITSPRDVPAADNAAVDGYAFAYSDYADTGGFFPVSARSQPGTPTRRRTGSDPRAHFHRRRDAGGSRYGRHAGGLRGAYAGRH